MTCRSLYRALSDAKDAADNAMANFKLYQATGNHEMAGEWLGRWMHWNNRVRLHEGVIEHGRRLERAVEAEGESV
jgi:endonuclease III